MADSVTRKLLIEEATKRGWQVSTFGPLDYYCKITDKKGQTEIFRGSRPTRSSANGMVIAKYKNLTMDYVGDQGFEVPAYLLVEADDQAAQHFLANNKTIVVKPADAQQSLGITTGVKDERSLAMALEYATANSLSGRAVLQKQLEGKLYRLFVVDGRLMAAAQRRAAQVIGDGETTIKQLVERLNDDPRRGEANDSPLKKIKLSDVKTYLGEARLNEIPETGQIVRVSAIDSVSAGGEAIDVTSQVHADWRQATEQLASKAGLLVAGFDVICDDIATPLVGKYLPLLEINSSPGLKLHMYPTGGGQSINLAPVILDASFA